MNETIASTIIMKRSTSEDEDYSHRMLSTDERVELWCTVLFFEHLDCNKRLKNEREGEWFHLGGGRSKRHHITVTHHHHLSLITYYAS